MAHVAYRYSLDQLVDLRVNVSKGGFRASKILVLTFHAIFESYQSLGQECWLNMEGEKRPMASYEACKGVALPQVSPEFEISMSLVFLESLPVLNLESRYSTYSTSRGNG